ncbi:unnamed protein product [Linum trigynum]|uniref:Uncharacterized protein n=1 Tax=Linum trigynum TaxID=586398 RepID=A0AAV2FVH3_9ROSI
MFYANMRPCYNTNPPSFTTIVFNYLITINVDLLSQLLSIPISGIVVMNESEFPDAEFNELVVIRTLTTVYPTDQRIMASAKENRVISYPHLMFDHMLLHVVDDVVPLPEDGLNIADLVEDVSNKGKQKAVLHHLDFIRQSFQHENEASTSGKISEDPKENEEDISDYITSPPYPF